MLQHMAKGEDEKHQTDEIVILNQSMELTVRVGEPDVTHRTSWRESTGECQRHLVSIALQKEANATVAFVRTKQGIMLLPNACIKGQ